jgi:SOS response regulatory protein OraA/RecX
MVDDRLCARLWADHWARRGYAWSAIRVKLSEKGLDEQAIEHAASWLGTASDDDARARLVIAQRLRRRAGARQRSRLGRALASRGFDSDLIERILNESFGPD